MTNAYNWTVDKMICLPENQQVVTAFFTVSATDGTHTSAYSNAVGIQLDPSEELIPYTQLTQDTVLVWVKNNLTDDGVSAIELQLDQIIADKISPPVVTLQPPWK